MAKYRRSNYVFFTLEELGSDFAAAATKLVATSIISGQHLLVTAERIELLQRIETDQWIEGEEAVSEGFTSELLAELSRLGILLSDEPAYCEFLEREERLIASHFPPCAAAFHLLNHHHESRISGYRQVEDTVSKEKRALQRAADFLERYGPPPATFREHAEAEGMVVLDPEIHESPLASILLNRRTCRHFEPNASLSSGALSKLLRIGLGPVGVRRLAEQLELLLKTSPSGGSLHPIEGYPLILRGDQEASGLYHYRCDLHALEILRRIPEHEARELSVYFAQGQSFVGTCSAIVILVARFDRNFWKYRERENSYAVVLQDAAHISQTFQLVAADLGLSSFYTAAINSEALTRFLGLQYPAEAPLGILGFGYGLKEEVLAGVEPFILKERV